MSKTKWIYIGAAGALILAIGGGVGAAILNSNKSVIPMETNKTEVNVSTGETYITSESIYDIPDDDWANTVMYNGKTYKLRDDIKTVLFMGIDSDININENDITGGGGRADTVLLFVIDETNNKLNILEISRETVVDVDVYNTDREYMYTGPMQICLQYSFSDTSTRGCLLMKDKVSNLLYGIKIDNYCSLTVNGMVDIVNAMGGITVTFEDDYSYLNEEYTIGNTVTLDGSAVNTFVRYRDTEELASNNDRMDRQAWFLKELFKQMTGKGASNLVDLYNAAGDHLCTDMDIEEIKTLSSVKLGDISKAPGEVVKGDAHAEFYVDDVKLRELIIELLYEEI